MGAFLWLAASPLGCNVAAGRRPASLGPQAQPLPPGPILGHPCVARVDGYPVEQVPEPVEVRGPWCYPGGAGGGGGGGDFGAGS